MRNKKTIKKVLLLAVIVHAFGLSNLFAEQKTPEELYLEELVQEYVPQNTPDKSYQLELKLMTDSMYCYDLPLFDPEWRKHGKKILTSPEFIDAAKTFKVPFKTFSKDQHAVIYYPDNFHLNPVFLYQEKGGWVIDRTAIVREIQFDPKGIWIMSESNSPYLKLLNEIFQLKSVPMNGEMSGYTPIKTKI